MGVAMTIPILFSHQHVVNSAHLNTWIPHAHGPLVSIWHPKQLLNLVIQPVAQNKILTPGHFSWFLSLSIPIAKNFELKL